MEKGKNIFIGLCIAIIAVLGTLLTLSLTGILNIKEPNDNNVVDESEDNSGEGNTNDTDNNGPQVRKDILSSIDKCINDNIKCSNGTIVNVKVNDTEEYKFYVIADTGTKLTLIMDRNLGGNVNWITKEDYEAAGGTNWEKTTPGGAVVADGEDKGPLTALKILKERTEGWTNIPLMTYKLTDAVNGGYIAYDGFDVKDVRARMITYDEIESLGCTGVSGSCPHYLTDNLVTSKIEGSAYGYWSSSVYYGQNGAGVAGYGGRAVNNAGCFYQYCGVRPIIEISKNI